MQCLSNHLYNHFWLNGKKVDEHSQISLKSEILKPYDGKLHVGGFQLSTTEYNRKSKETPWKAYVPSIVHICNRTEIVLPVQFFLQSHGAGSRYFSIFMPQTLQVVLRTLYATSLLIHQSIHPSICLSVVPSIHSSPFYLSINIYSSYLLSLLFYIFYMCMKFYIICLVFVFVSIHIINYW